jgi:hypothetical protein
MYPSRLFVYLASDAPVAAVLSRGPTDWAQLSLWHTDTDRVEPGQWLKGRVYERRSDLSSDGRLFAAFVRQSGGREPDGADTWMAISRPPYFSALAVWFVGGTYHTGPCFPDGKALWTGFAGAIPPDRGTVPAWLQRRGAREISYVDGTGEWPERTVHFNRLLRDGWQLLDRDQYCSIWQRRHPHRPITLEMTHAFDGTTRGHAYRVEYRVQQGGAPEQSIGEASWADWDQRGRLVVARAGQLRAWDVDTGTERLIADFNGRSPDPQPPPAWALEWPKAARR